MWIQFITIWEAIAHMIMKFLRKGQIRDTDLEIYELSQKSVPK